MKKIVKTLLLLCMLIVAMGTMPITVNATGEENPRVIIESFSISEDEIIPGQEFELTLTIRNTSQFYDIYSVVVTMEDLTKSIYPVYGTANQVYIDRIYARKNTEIVIPLKAMDDISSSVIPLQFNISYNDNYFIEKQDNDMEIYLPVRLKGDLKVVSSSVPNSVSVGAKARVSVTYENTGSVNLYNIVLKVKTKDSEAKEIDMNLYNLNGGEKTNAEVYIDCPNTGRIPVSFYFEYEDENGEVYKTDSVSHSFSVVEQDAEVEMGSVTVVGGGVSFLTFILLAAIVIVAIMILFIIKKMRRR